MSDRRADSKLRFAETVKVKDVSTDGVRMIFGTVR
jgi:hypothetical protein